MRAARLSDHFRQRHPAAHCGRSRRLWVYGRERRVHAPGAPKPWGKLALVGLAIALVVVGLVWAAVTFIDPSSF